MIELRRSKHGIGVFTDAPIKKNAPVKLWEKGDWKLRAPKTLKELQLCNKWCIYAWDKLWCPASFTRMSLSWYVNHSKKPNLRSHFTKKGNWRFWATRNIQANEELMVDYAILDYVDKA